MPACCLCRCAITLHPFRYTSIFTQNAHLGGPDLIFGDDGTIASPTAEAATDGQDIVIAGQGSDTVFGGGADDDLIGGHNVAGGHDAGDDLDGGSGHDVIAGDNAAVLRTGSPVSDQFRTLAGQAMYDSAGVPLVTPDARANPAGVRERFIRPLDHSDSPAPGTWGNDYIAGGTEDDRIFGQLGDDVIQGDGSILGKFTGGPPVSASRDALGNLFVAPSFETTRTATTTSRAAAATTWCSPASARTTSSAAARRCTG